MRIYSLMLTLFLTLTPLFSKTIFFVSPHAIDLPSDKKYLPYAFEDLACKEITIFSPFFENDVDKQIIRSTSSYSEIKRNAASLSKTYNADSVVASAISFYEGKVTLTYFIYYKNRPYEWKERTRSEEEVKFYILVKDFLNDFYEFTKTKPAKAGVSSRLNEETYIPLIGYYQETVILKDECVEDEQMFFRKRKDIFDKFYMFFKDNFYCNLDYYEYLLDSRNSDLTDEIMNSLQTYAPDNNHYLLYLLSQRMFYLYRRQTKQEDYIQSMNFIAEALSKQDSSYLYHYCLARLFFLREDFANAKMGFNSAINLNPYHIPSYKGLLHILSGEALKENNTNMINYAEKILLVEPENEFALKTIISLYEAEGDFEKALTHAETYLAFTDKEIAFYMKNAMMHQKTLYYLKAKRRSIHSKAISLSRRVKEEQ